MQKSVSSATVCTLYGRIYLNVIKMVGFNDIFVLCLVVQNDQLHHVEKGGV